MGDVIDPALTRLSSALYAWLPTVLIAVGILAVGVALGFLLRALAGRAVKRVFSEWLDPQAGASSSPMKAYGATGLLLNATFWVPVILAAIVAADVVGLSVFSTWLSGITNYLPRLIAAIIIVLIGAVAARFAATGAEELLRPFAGELSGSIAPATRLLVLGVSVMVAAEQAGIDLSVLTTFLLLVLGLVLGGTMLALALGARQSIENILAMHHVRQSVELQTRLRIDGVEGTVIRLTSTTVQLSVEDGIMEIPGTRFAALGFARVVHTTQTEVNNVT